MDINLTLVAFFLALLAYAIYTFFRQEKFALAGRALLWLGLAGNTWIIIERWLVSGRPPFSNMYESMLVFAWSIIAIYLYLEKKYEIKFVGAFVTALGLLVFASIFLLDNSIQPLMPALQSNWLILHVLLSFIAYAAFGLSFVTGLIYLANELAKKQDKARLNKLDLVTNNMISLGLLFLTLGIMSGSIWANNAWGRYWGWDPKETWALITWIYYAAYTHLRVVRGWRGGKAAWLAVFGFVLVIFTYVGVNYLLSGLHSYAS